MGFGQVLNAPTEIDTSGRERTGRDFGGDPRCSGRAREGRQGRGGGESAGRKGIRGLTSSAEPRPRAHGRSPSTYILAGSGHVRLAGQVPPLLAASRPGLPPALGAPPCRRARRVLPVGRGPAGKKWSE